MKYIKTFSDERLDNICSYCGDFPKTRDHVPSRILLDEPFPENLPVVPCCLKCNQSFSLDEEYVACAIECIIHGTTEIDLLQRKKVRAILSRKTQLRQRIESSFVVENDHKYFKVEHDRFENIVVKLAKGHAKYENSEPKFDPPTSIFMKPLFAMQQSEVDIFFAPPPLDKAPEVGSRALHRLVVDGANNILSDWTTVQEGIYEYSVTIGLGVLIVRIVIWNYLAVEVAWDN